MELEILYVCEKEYEMVTERFTQSKIHVHDHTEVSIILSGKANYMINDKPYTLKAGELVVFNPGIKHSVDIPMQGTYRDLHIGIHHILNDLVAAHDAFNTGFVIINYHEKKKQIAQICKELNYEATHRNAENKLMIESLVMQLYVLICRLMTAESNFQTEHTACIGYPDKRKVVDFITTYINENYMNEISLEMFAKDIYLSQVYISKIFKEETGHSPIHYLIKKRLSTAKQLLESEDLPIKVISSKVGYQDVYHFSKLFKKYYGYPPSAVRRKISHL